MTRKRICLITILPENETPRRIMTGVFSQCNKYGYDVCVVSSLVSVCNYYKNYLQGELNIYNLINPDLFDAFIITPVPMTEDRNLFLYKSLLKKFKDIKKPFVSIDCPFGAFPVVYTDDKLPFYHITEHLIKKHKCRNFDVLSGSDDSQLTNMRLEGIFDALKDNKIDFDINRVFRGDYWYLGGEKLANRYISGELELPDAIICLSDHMAIGLINRLIQNNIRVPEDVIVTGFGAVREAALNTPPVTSCVPFQADTGKKAVDYIHNIFEGKNKTGKEEDKPGKTEIKFGMTCGCKEDFSYTRSYIQNEGRSLKYNYADNNIWNNIDLTMLQESYMAENLTAAVNPKQCIEKIYESKYLIKPYKRFYICLNEDWLKPDLNLVNGYKKNMLLTISAEAGSKYHGYTHHVFFGDGNEIKFPSKKMIPALQEEFSSPQVFYFTPLHFGNECLGYSVLQNNLDEPGIIGEVYRNYLRNINNALEMTRTKNSATYLSEHDSMTQLRNRRGMESFMNIKMKNAGKNDSIFAIVIDMDGLKNRNDKYGHSEGDKGIKIIAKAAASITASEEVCVRGGGDEFFVLGIGRYTDKKIEEKISNFECYIETANETMEIPVSASIGYCLMPYNEEEGFQIVLDKADANMYQIKRAKKRTKRKFQMKRIITVQDISCIGKCSLTVALPVISAMGVEACVLPTAVLSTHTAFKGFTFRDLTKDISKITAHWKEEKLHFDAIYTGYLGSFEQINIIEKFIEEFASNDTLIIVDPCMGDNGVLYSGFTKDFADSMANLCAHADVIAPNLTEAAFMLGIPYADRGYSKEQVEDILKKLAGLGAKKIVLKGISFDEKKLGIAAYDSENEKISWYFHEKMPQNFHGTGDIFASVLTGSLVRGNSLEKSYRLAADFVVESIHATLSHADYNWYGVDFEKAIPFLISQLSDNLP